MSCGAGWGACASESEVSRHLGNSKADWAHAPGDLSSLEEAGGKRCSATLAEAVDLGTCVGDDGSGIPEGDSAALDSMLAEMSDLLSRGSGSAAASSDASDAAVSRWLRHVVFRPQ